MRGNWRRSDRGRKLRTGWPSKAAKVTMLEMLPEIVKDGEHTPNKYLKERLAEYQVAIYTSTEVTEIRDDCVIAERGELYRNFRCRYGRNGGRR